MAQPEVAAFITALLARICLLAVQSPHIYQPPEHLTPGRRMPPRPTTVIPIVGFCGRGKSTLTNGLYSLLKGHSIQVSLTGDGREEKAGTLSVQMFPLHMLLWPGNPEPPAYVFIMDTVGLREIAEPAEAGGPQHVVVTPENAKTLFAPLASGCIEPGAKTTLAAVSDAAAAEGLPRFSSILFLGSSGEAAPEDFDIMGLLQEALREGRKPGSVAAVQVVGVMTKMEMHTKLHHYLPAEQCMGINELATQRLYDSVRSIATDKEMLSSLRIAEKHSKCPRDRLFASFFCDVFDVSELLYGTREQALDQLVIAQHIVAPFLAAMEVCVAISTQETDALVLAANRKPLSKDAALASMRDLAAQRKAAAATEAAQGGGKANAKAKGKANAKAKGAEGGGAKQPAAYARKTGAPGQREAAAPGAPVSLLTANVPAVIAIIKSATEARGINVPGSRVGESLERVAEWCRRELVYGAALVAMDAAELRTHLEALDVPVCEGVISVILDLVAPYRALCD